jgi:hypothetical protein
MRCTSTFLSPAAVCSSAGRRTTGLMPVESPIQALVSAKFQNPAFATASRAHDSAVFSWTTQRHPRSRNHRRRFSGGKEGFKLDGQRRRKNDEESALEVCPVRRPSHSACPRTRLQESRIPHLHRARCRSKRPVLRSHWLSLRRFGVRKQLFFIFAFTSTAILLAVLAVVRDLHDER